MKTRERRPDHDHSQRPTWRRSQAAPAIAPGKRTLTAGLSSRPDARPLQHHLPGGVTQPERDEGPPVDDWMCVAVRPDLYQAPIQRKSVHGVGYAGGEPQARVSTAGVPLPAVVQARMERSFGADFSAVRVHQGDHVTDLGARAYTQGTDIHFAPGQYDPASQAGMELLGHELTHVVQQAQGRVAPTAQAKGLAINDSSALEREADELGARAARGEVLPRAGVAAAPSQIVQGMLLAKDDPARQGIKLALERTAKVGWNERNLEDLILWAKDAKQVMTVLETIDYADWVLIDELHPGGVTHSKATAIARLAEECKKRAKFSASASTPAELLQDQLDRVLDARDRSADKEMKLPLDKKSNYANASVFVDDTLLFSLVIPFESGRTPEDKKFRAPEQHLNTEDDPRVQQEEHQTHGDSEVRLLQALHKGLEDRRQAVTQAKSLVVQIVSSYGACDNCKDRLDDFLAEWQQARIEYHYYTKRERYDGRNPETTKTRAAAYGWGSDQQDTPVETISHGARLLYKHVIDANDLERRRAAREWTKVASPQPTDVTSEPKNDNQLAAPKDSSVVTGIESDNRTATPSMRQSQPEGEATYWLNISSKAAIDTKGLESATNNLKELVGAIAKKLELTIDEPAPKQDRGKLGVELTVQVPIARAHELRRAVLEAAEKGLTYFVPRGKKGSLMMQAGLDHALEQQ